MFLYYLRKPYNEDINEHKSVKTMRDSFFHFIEYYMTTKRPEDFELVHDYVVEQTRIASMEQMGVDLTQQNTGDFQQGFTIEEREVGQADRLCFVWWDYSECEKHIDCPVLQNDIAKHFWPDIQFISSRSGSLFTGGKRHHWRLE